MSADASGARNVSGNDSGNPLDIPEFPTEAEYPEPFVARYELLELLSENDYAKTLLVRDRSSGALCVAKCCGTDSPLCGRTEPEGLRNLPSSPLPAFVADFRDDKTYCVLREYVPGESLDRVCGKRRFSDAEIIRIGEQLCGQLLLLHQLDPPVIHRDIKPENVILRPDGQAVLIDFGIAREYRADAGEFIFPGENRPDAGEFSFPGENRPDAGEFSSPGENRPDAGKFFLPGENGSGGRHPEFAGLSSDTVIMGTKGFAAPEQYGFSQTDARSDIYSLGMLLAWLCRFRDSGSEAGKPKDSSALTRIIRKCCAFDPSRRYRNAAALKRALHKAAVIRTTGWYVRRFAAVSVPLILAAVILSRVFTVRNPAEAAAVSSAEPPAEAVAISFTEPLIEESVRMQLFLPDDAPVPSDRLAEVTGLYIVNDKAYRDETSFYDAIGDLYTGGKIPHGTLSSLEDIRLLPSLTRVCIAAQSLTDIRALSALKHLEKLEIKHNQVEDISVLKGMESLVSVGINDNPVTDISVLTQCPNLAYLDLCDVRDYDASVIGMLGDFQYLDLSNPTDSYRHLGGRDIVRLRLAWTSFSSLEDLKDVTGLEELDISHTKVTDLTGLEVHKDLKRLNLSALFLHSLKILEQLPCLETVTLSREMAPLAGELGDPAFSIVYE